jgi:hypothetical protein
MLRQKLSTAWHFGQSETLCAAVVEGSTRIAANGVRRASFIRCFQVTYSGWAEILLKAELSKPHGRLEGSLTNQPAAGGMVLRRWITDLGKAAGVVGTDGRVKLRKQLYSNRSATIESIVEHLVFNTTLTGNLRAVAERAKRYPKRRGGSPLLGAQAGIRDAKQRTPTRP